ncbi:MAG TPA: hypothetical protein LFW11_02700 [Rickettsia endosymbiont of Proechinophthirus fluctus]|uniref:hypothetical protein n=1 Tax=Rickettsia endosymbiont of Proechinophthirus fluctus TaxID=1462733 RepID=UPI000789CD5B|nr:hypothetical protein [Rickettsia endosymbiont of Proechinophthirus fluctus]KYP97887.1 hypothetical protein BG75_02135 [Rickettsia endosymbiont of Proechinophthirus fluctus]HJD54270.1 hypothetical protein [Rickettsia endosymbiont of Proechinophthirus fluctus]
MSLLAKSGGGVWLVYVIPAEAGIQQLKGIYTVSFNIKSSIYLALPWIPAFAGMTSNNLLLSNKLFNKELYVK